MQIDRRLFLLSAASSLYAGPLVTFSEREAKILEALAEQIVPADDAPGATQAGVVFYIDKQLHGPLKRFAATYQRSIPLFEKFCNDRTGKDFTSLPFAEQTALLKIVESKVNPELASFFTTFTDHVMQGYYGSPAHGGNRDEASWKMLQIQDVMGGHKH